MVVGRSRICHLRLADPKVSSEHLSLSWQEGQWRLRDLGSRNGTTLNGEHLRPGEERNLSRGDQLEVGALRLQLVDDSGPEACAHLVPGDRMQSASGGMLALPDEDHPTVTVFQGPEGQWLGEREGVEWEIFDGELISVEEQSWMLHLPRGHEATVEARTRGVEIGFAVSSDEERVDLHLVIEGVEQVLESRAHYYTLLTLARARMQDRDKPENREGWRQVPELCRMLRCDENKLNVDIFRCRQDLGRSGLTGAATVVERRRTTREVRYRPEQVQIRRLGRQG